MKQNFSNHAKSARPALDSTSVGFRKPKFEEPDAKGERAGNNSIHHVSGYGCDNNHIQLSEGDISNSQTQMAMNIYDQFYTPPVNTVPELSTPLDVLEYAEDLNLDTYEELQKRFDKDQLAETCEKLYESNTEKNQQISELRSALRQANALILEALKSLEEALKLAQKTRTRAADAGF